MPLKRIAHWVKRKVRIRFVRRPNAGQLYITITGWPFSLHLNEKPDDTPISNTGRYSSSTSIRLNIGGGKGHPRVDGWMIVDLRESADLVLDITKARLPYDDNTVDVIFTSHILEHIYPQQLGFVLSEFYRVLKSDVGLLRIGVPDIEMAIQAYVSEDYGFFQASDIAEYDPKAPLGGLLASWFYSTRIFNDPELRHGEGHVHCFDYDYLAYWLKGVGFRRVWRSAYRQSALPELRGDAFDRHPNDTLFVEAMK
jgi:hypothetical protein